ncbi:MAG TPA: YcbK family protein [Caulobacteraceae bacterium]|nr:YcbK family protein [Caulobacteraceae bacterium]
MPLARRELLRTGLSLAAASATFTLPALAHADAYGARKLGFKHLHTGETLDVAYWENGAYVPGALTQVNHVLRDWRTDQVHVIEPKLLDLLTALQARLGQSERFDVICGYRSPATNAMLHEHSDEVAVHSLHLVGEAIDIHLPGVELSRLRDAAMGLGLGGVGYYPESDFVHVDIGRVRHWGGN